MSKVIVGQKKVLGQHNLILKFSDFLMKILERRGEFSFNFFFEMFLMLIFLPQNAQKDLLKLKNMLYMGFFFNNKK